MARHRPIRRRIHRDGHFGGDVARLEQIRDLLLGAAHLGRQLGLGTVVPNGTLNE
ncbi:hypothetical protein O9Z70_06275 [Devosia sp. YIM 151766]|nr:hypothetical protein [Devosia sp. YIM 151766]WIY54123.1 hypothetical protein O9Z70_06275 [Devosia sp. YIM 151766]